MTVRENWDVKWLKGIAVQQNWITQVSLADTLNIIWGTVTDVNWVATITIPEKEEGQSVKSEIFFSRGRNCKKLLYENVPNLYGLSLQRTKNMGQWIK